MTMVLATNWNTVWLMTGMGLGVVFFILLSLVFILSFFNLIFTPRNGIKIKGRGDQEEPLTSADGLDQTAVIMAVHLFLEEKHDEESDIITIQQQPSNWHAELNESL